MDSKRVFKRILNRAKALNAKIFRERKILIVSDSHIFSIPLRPRLQQVTLAVTIAVLVWSAYSNGRFLAYQGIIAQKEIEVLRSNMENRELQELYQSLQSEMSGLNGMMDALQKNANLDANGKEKPLPRKGERMGGGDSKLQNPADIRKYTAMVRRSVQQKVEEHTRRLENAITTTGLDMDRILRKTPAAKLRSQIAELNSGQDKQANTGGPFIPASVGQQGAAEISPEEMHMRFQYLLELTRVMNTVPLGVPLKKMKMTSEFGVRTDPFSGEMALHSGIDFKEKQGADVYATAKGKVIYAGWMGAYGNLVEIDHGKGLVTRYGHLSDIYVKEGQKVDRYDIVGAQGSTGRSNGSHVHYEVRVDDEAVNPDKFIKAGGHVY